MKTAEMKAVMVANEINLNEIAAHFGINKKFKWEDILCLDSNHLKGILKEVENKRVFIFHFGSMVFMNVTFHEIKDVLNYLKKLDNSLPIKSAFDQMEEYKVKVGDPEEYIVDNEAVTIPEELYFYYEIAAMILAKSVALDKIEIDVDAVFDKVEEIMDKLKEGNLNIKDRQLSSLSARILTFKYNTISYIMLLDKPDIVWDNTDAERVYNDLSHLFELDERYENVRMKTEALMDITEMFASLAMSRRDARLEWIIIILIAVEIVMSLTFHFLPG